MTPLPARLLVSVRNAKEAEDALLGGADIIDVGGESTRPGAANVSEQDEIDRVVPVIEAVRQASDVIISIDTSKASVMEAAVGAGAGIINDVRALREPQALETAARLGLPVCVMHMQGQPRTMQQNPAYADVVLEVTEFLAKRYKACIDAGISSDQIIIDPGFGFGKTTHHNLSLLYHLERLCDVAPVLTGLSRKRMFAELLESDSADRVSASVAAALLCVQRGASIVRVHDVRQTVDALKVYSALDRMGLELS
jgi:dihydropteroate synthase